MKPNRQVRNNGPRNSHRKQARAGSVPAPALTPSSPPVDDGTRPFLIPLSLHAAEEIQCAADAAGCTFNEFVASACHQAIHVQPAPEPLAGYSGLERAVSEARVLLAMFADRICTLQEETGRAGLAFGVVSLSGDVGHRLGAEFTGFQADWWNLRSWAHNRGWSVPPTSADGKVVAP